MHVRDAPRFARFATCAWVAAVSCCVWAIPTIAASDAPEAIQRRRDALEAHSRLTREIASLRAKATREKQLNRRVDLNLEIQRLEAEIAAHKNNL